MLDFLRVMFPMPRMFGHFTEEHVRRIRHPKVELSTNVTFKFVEGLTAVGTGYGAYLALSQKATRSIIGLRLKVTQMGNRGLILGLLLGPAATHVYTVVNEIDTRGMYELCLKHRQNENLMRRDKWALLGAMSGTFMSKRSNMGGIYGLIWGITVSVLLISPYNAYLVVAQNKAVHGQMKKVPN